LLRVSETLAAKAIDVCTALCLSFMLAYALLLSSIQDIKYHINSIRRQRP